MPHGVLTGPRRLMLDVPHYQGDFAAGSFPEFNGWINDGLTNAIMFESSIDLSGYELDKLTLVPQGTELQDPGRYVYDVPGAVSYPVVDVEILDIISQERLSLTAIDAALTLGNVPGMLGTTEDFTQIIMGNYRVMVVSNSSANLELLMPVSGGIFGSGEPTAASRLWVYRVARINGVKGPTDILKIPASRFILVGTVVDEDELPYMMRLKRSFELAQG